MSWLKFHCMFFLISNISALVHLIPTRLQTIIKTNEVLSYCATRPRWVITAQPEQEYAVTWLYDRAPVEQFQWLPPRRHALLAVKHIALTVLVVAGPKREASFACTAQICAPFADARPTWGTFGIFVATVFVPFATETLKGHRVLWKIEICNLIRMIYEWKRMSSGWHNHIVITHLDEIPTSVKSSGWHMVVWDTSNC